MENNSQVDVTGDQNGSWIETPGMRAIIEYAIPDAVEAMLSTKEPILLVAPTGTGKSYILEKIIQSAKIDQQRVLKVNCATFPETLVDSELFGYKKGAFTGAQKDFNGLLSSENIELLVLDEINSLPKHVQAKLLTFLDSGEYRSIGSQVNERSEVKIIGISNSPKSDPIFRPDFFFRFYCIAIPPLHQRREDVFIFLRKLCPDITWHHKELFRLMCYNWPGNVRELVRFSRLVNRHKQKIERENVLLSYLFEEFVSSSGFMEYQIFDILLNEESQAPFWEHLRRLPESVRLLIDKMLPCLSFARNNLPVINDDSDDSSDRDADELTESFAGDIAVDWLSFCLLFGQDSRADHDILKNIEKGNLTRFPDYYYNFIESPVTDEEVLLTKEIIRSHFGGLFQQPTDRKNKPKANDIEEFEDDKNPFHYHLLEVIERLNPLKYKEAWIQRQIDKKRKPSEIALQYNLERKTTGQWLRVHKKKQLDRPQTESNDCK